MTDDLTGKLSADEKAALRLTAAREFMNCLEPLGEGNNHEKLSAAFASILAVAGPPVDYSCAAFSLVASILLREGGRRVDVHVLSPQKTEVHSADGILRTFTHEPDDGDDIEPEPTLQ